MELRINIFLGGVHEKPIYREGRGELPKNGRGSLDSLKILGGLGKKEGEGAIDTPMHSMFIASSLLSLKMQNSFQQGPKIFQLVIYKFTLRWLFQQFDRAENFWIPKAFNIVSK